MTYPVATPKILFWTLPPIPILQISEFELRTVGAFAVAGALFKTVDDTVFVLALVSVTTIATVTNKNKIIPICFTNISISFLLALILS